MLTTELDMNIFCKENIETISKKGLEGICQENIETSANKCVVFSYSIVIQAHLLLFNHVIVRRCTNARNARAIHVSKHGTYVCTYIRMDI